MRSVLYVVVGVVVGLGLQAPLWAVNVRQSEADRLGRIDATAFDPQSRGTTQVLRGRHVELLQVPVGSVVPPPGLVEPLAPGEAWLSPGLLALVRSEPTVRSWFDRYRMMEMPTAATSSAGELKAYLADDGGVGPSFVAGRPTLGAFAQPIGAYQLVGFVVFGAAPALAMLLVASRFGHEPRSRRWRALRTVGFPARSARLLLGFELAVPMALGCAVAIVVPVVALSGSVSLPLTGRRYYAQDAYLSPLQVGGVLFVASVAAFAVGSRVWAAPSMRRGRRVLALAPFLAAALLTGWTWVLPRPNDLARTVAVVLFAGGLPAATERAAAVAARLAGRISAGPLWLLVVRSTARDPRVAGRIAGLVAAGVFAAAVAGPIAFVTSAGSPHWTQAAKAAGASTMLVNAESLDGSGFPWDGVPREVLPVAGLWRAGQGPPARPAATALIATCDQARTLIDPNLFNCTGRAQVVSSRGTGVIDLTGLNLVSADTRSTQAIEAGTDTVALSGTEAIGFDPTFLLPPDLARPGGHDPYLTKLFGRVSATTPGPFERFQAAVIGAAPGFRVESAFTGSYQPDSSAAWIALGNLVVVVIVLVAGLLSAISDRASRTRSSAWEIAGLSRRMVAAVRVAAVTICTAAGTSLAVVAAVAVVSSYGRVNGEGLLSGPALAAIAAAGLTIPIGIEVTFARFRL